MELISRGHEPAFQVIQADARNAFRIMKAGGVAVLPMSVSYAIFAHTARGVERIFELKQRAQTKPNGVIGNWDIFSEVLDTNARDKDLVRCIIQDHNLPLSVIAPFKPEHDWLRTVEFGGLRRATKGNTMDLLLNAGRHAVQRRFLIVKNTLRLGCQNLNLMRHREVFVLRSKVGQQLVARRLLKNRLVVAQQHHVKVLARRIHDYQDVDRLAAIARHGLNVDGLKHIGVQRVSAFCRVVAVEHRPHGQGGELFAHQQRVAHLLLQLGAGHDRCDGGRRHQPLRQQAGRKQPRPQLGLQHHGKKHG